MLVINPNTNAQITQEMSLQIAAETAGNLCVEATNPANGPFSVETAADRAWAVETVMELIADYPDMDAYVLACFDDIAVDEARNLVTGQVFSIAQSAIQTAVETARPYSVVTTVEGQIPTIRKLLAKYDPAGRGTVRACGVGVADAFQRTDHAEAQLELQITCAINGDGAECIILGSGAYAGRGRELSDRYGVRFVDGMSSALAFLSSP